MRVVLTSVAIVFISAVFIFTNQPQKETYSLDEEPEVVSLPVEQHQAFKAKNSKQVSKSINPPTIIKKPVNSIVDVDNSLLDTIYKNASLLAIKKISLDNENDLKPYLNDSDSEVRIAAIGRYLELEGEYELDENVIRNNRQSGKFVNEILNHLEEEKDGFVLQKSFDYLWQYAGKFDENVNQSIGSFLQREDLSVDVLTRIGELKIDRFDVPVKNVLDTLEQSPSYYQLSDFDNNYLSENLKSF